LTAFYFHRLAKFTSVFDNNGKLIVAEYRKGIQNYWRTDFIFDNDTDRHDLSYLFHLDYLVPAIKTLQMRSCSLDSTKEQQQQKEEIHFETHRIFSFWSKDNIKAEKRHHQLVVLALAIDMT
jgi:hypothetical protein